MSFLFHVLERFLLPVSVTVILLLLGVRLRRRALIVGGVALLWLCSMPFVSGLATRVLEGRATRLPGSDTPSVDAIVVLSEGRTIAPGRAAVSEWVDADRFFGGVELFKAGKARYLLFTGGAPAWEPNAALEGDILAGYAMALGVPESQILKTTRVTNTAEESQAVATLLRDRLSDQASGRITRRVLLVTSAFHMKRARWLFERAGMTVIPFSVDFKSSVGRSWSVLSFVPSGGALAQTEAAIRELYSRLYYWVVR